MAQQTSRKTGENKSCDQCGLVFYRRKAEQGRRFCSSACYHASTVIRTAEGRICKTCGQAFTYTRNPHGNSAGNYCSVPCRNAGYQHHYRGRPGHFSKRTGWPSIARSFKRRGNDFCGVCGKTNGRIDVHHVEPCRLRQNNDDWNLMSLCAKHHRAMEKISAIIADLPAERRAYAVHLLQGLLGDLYHENHGKKLLGIQ